MFKPGDIVKVVKSKELEKWTNGKEVVGKVGEVTASGLDGADGGKVSYILDENKYQINFSGNSLRHASKVEIAAYKESKKPTKVSLPESAKESLVGHLKEMLGDLKEKKEDLRDEAVQAVMEHTSEHCEQLAELRASDRRLGYAIWALVAYNIFHAVMVYLF